MNYILFDIGSSTVKCYRYTSKKLQCIKQVSIHFKKNFQDNKDENISIDDKNTLISLLKKIKEEYPKDIIKTYATSVFRDISKKNKNELSEEIYLKTGIILNIIDQTTESIYLQIALLGKYKTKKNVLFINIGGGSTELIVVNNNKVIERKNVALGVGVINNEFIGINDSLSKVEINDVISFVKRKLPKLKSIVDTAFYTGGELKYMQLVRYPLKKNRLFKDVNHPLVISFKDFQKKRH